MNLYQVNYDTVLITLYAQDVDDMIELLNEDVGDCDDFYLEDGVLYYLGFDLDEPYACMFREVDAERGIIQQEAH